MKSDDNYIIWRTLGARSAHIQKSRVTLWPEEIQYPFLRVKQQPTYQIVGSYNYARGEKYRRGNAVVRPEDHVVDHSFIY